MGVGSPAALPSTSPDITRLGLVTATPQAITDEDVRGAIYDPATLAAGRLVHVQPTGSESRFLVVYSDIWNEATPNQTVPGTFSAKTALALPMAYWVHSESGDRVPAIDRGGAAGQLYPRATLKLVGGSDNARMMYLLALSGTNPAMLAYRVTAGALDYVSSSWIQSVQIGTDAANPVVWNKGIHTSGRYVYHVGSQPNGALHMRRAMIGNHRPWAWFRGDKGWMAQPSEMSPMRTIEGAVMTSVGPVSIARYHGEWYLSTTALVNTEYIVSFWRAANPFTGWHKLPKTVTLGTLANAATTTAYFQSLHPNPEHPSMVGQTAGIPFCYNVESSTALRTAWDVLPVPGNRL